MRTKDGKYVATRIMKQTNTELRCVGTTIEEARQKLKDEVKKYREGLAMGSPDIIQVTGEQIRSPGMAYFETKNGSFASKHDENRMVPVIARTDLAKHIQKLRKEGLR